MITRSNRVWILIVLGRLSFFPQPSLDETMAHLCICQGYGQFIIVFVIQKWASFHLNWAEETIEAPPRMLLLPIVTFELSK